MKRNKISFVEIELLFLSLSRQKKTKIRASSSHVASLDASRVASRDHLCAFFFGIHNFFEGGGGGRMWSGKLSAQAQANHHSAKFEGQTSEER